MAPADRLAIAATPVVVIALFAVFDAVVRGVFGHA